jgi:hypothetical protein
VFNFTNLPSHWQFQENQKLLVDSFGNSKTNQYL